MVLKNATLSIAGKVLLEKTTLAFEEGKKFGLIGRNGAGKTTFFKFLLGKTTLDAGEFECSKSLKIVTVSQDAPSGLLTPFECLLSSDARRSYLMTQLEICEDPNKMGDIYEELIQMDAFTADARASKLLNGLGFTDEMQKKPLDHFSGGYRMRVALAAALFQSPDLLLLDEPTNHLDLEAVMWLKKFLKSYSKTLIVISHDRSLLNSCIDEVVHLNHKTLTRYKGNYDQFEKTLALQQASAKAFNEKVDAKKEKWMSFVNKFRAKATKSSQAQSRLKAISKLSYVNVIEKEENDIEFSFPASQNLSNPFLRYEKLFLGYETNGKESVILKYINGSIGPEDRIALLGANGNGKSTFAKFLAGRLKPLRGDVFRDHRLKVGFFHQHQLEELELTQSAHHHISKLMPKANDTQVRTYLGRFGFSGEKADLQVTKLSGGEKARLVFAMICVDDPHILILDEPTNHLDMEMRESLMMAVNMFPGAVIVISHDWNFLKHTVDQLWIIKDQKIHIFQGNLEDYVKTI